MLKLGSYEYHAVGIEAVGFYALINFHCPVDSNSNFALNNYDSGCDCTTIIISYTVQSPMFLCSI